jgi:hypothetical protein
MVHGVSAIMVLLRFAETGHEKAITENLEMDGASSASFDDQLNGCCPGSLRLSAMAAVQRQPGPELWASVGCRRTHGRQGRRECSRRMVRCRDQSCNQFTDAQGCCARRFGPCSTRPRLSLARIVDGGRASRDRHAGRDPSNCQSAYVLGKHQVTGESGHRRPCFPRR